MSNVSTKPIDGNFQAPEKARAKPKRIAAKKSGHPKPQWASVFESNLADVPGYAYAVAHHGHVVDEGASGFARSAIDAPQTPWTTQTRINLASVSKCVTTVALLRLFERRHISINDPFYPLIETRCPTAGAGVDTVTFKNLLEMKSGLVEDGTLWTSDLWSFLSTYLQQGLAGTPGVTEVYSNTNFTLMQAIISLLVDEASKGGDGIAPYVKYVSEHVLKPMRIDTAVFNPTPDPMGTATLSYALSDNGPGVYWDPINCVGCGGWVANAKELIKFLIGVRADEVLRERETREMLRQQLGWYVYDGVYGHYYDHNGWLYNGGTPNRGLNTGVVHLADDYDALLLVNAQWVDTIGLMIEAFEL